jgi:hypothetical protein
MDMYAQLNLDLYVQMNRSHNVASVIKVCSESIGICRIIRKEYINKPAELLWDTSTISVRQNSTKQQLALITKLLCFLRVMRPY